LGRAVGFAVCFFYSRRFSARRSSVSEQNSGAVAILFCYSPFLTMLL